MPVWPQIQQADVQRLFTLTSACLGTNNRASGAITRSFHFLRPVYHRPVSQARIASYIFTNSSIYSRSLLQTHPEVYSQSGKLSRPVPHLKRILLSDQCVGSYDWAVSQPTLGCRGISTRPVAHETLGYLSQSPIFNTTCTQNVYQTSHSAYRHQRCFLRHHTHSWWASAHCCSPCVADSISKDIPIPANGKYRIQNAETGLFWDERNFGTGT